MDTANTDISQSYIVPREDFLELQATAYGNDQSLSTRVASVAQTASVFGVMAGAIVLGTYGWAKVLDWREERHYQRVMRKENRDKQTGSTK